MDKNNEKTVATTELGLKEIIEILQLMIDNPNEFINSLSSGKISELSDTEQNKILNLIPQDESNIIMELVNNIDLFDSRTKGNVLRKLRSSKIDISTLEFPKSFICLDSQRQMKYINEIPQDEYDTWKFLVEDFDLFDLDTKMEIIRRIPKKVFDSWEIFLTDKKTNKEVASKIISRIKDELAEKKQLKEKELEERKSFKDSSTRSFDSKKDYFETKPITEKEYTNNEKQTLPNHLNSWQLNDWYQNGIPRKDYEFIRYYVLTTKDTSCLKDISEKKGIYDIWKSLFDGFEEGEKFSKDIINNYPLKPYPDIYVRYAILLLENISKVGPGYAFLMRALKKEEKDFSGIAHVLLNEPYVQLTILNNYEKCPPIFSTDIFYEIAERTKIGDDFLFFDQESKPKVVKRAKDKIQRSLLIESPENRLMRSEKMYYQGLANNIREHIGETDEKMQEELIDLVHEKETVLWLAFAQSMDKLAESSQKRLIASIPEDAVEVWDFLRDNMDTLAINTELQDMVKARTSNREDEQVEYIKEGADGNITTEGVREAGQVVRNTVIEGKEPDLGKQTKDEKGEGENGQ